MNIDLLPNKTQFEVPDTTKDSWAEWFVDSTDNQTTGFDGNGNRDGLLIKLGWRNNPYHFAGAVQTVTTAGDNFQFWRLTSASATPSSGTGPVRGFYQSVADDEDASANHTFMFVDSSQAATNEVAGTTHAHVIATPLLDARPFEAGGTILPQGYAKKPTGGGFLYDGLTSSNAQGDFLHMRLFVHAFGTDADIVRALEIKVIVSDEELGAKEFAESLEETVNLRLNASRVVGGGAFAGSVAGIVGGGTQSGQTDPYREVLVPLDHLIGHRFYIVIKSRVKTQGTNATTGTADVAIDHLSIGAWHWSLGNIATGNKALTDIETPASFELHKTAFLMEERPVYSGPPKKPLNTTF